MARPKKDGLLYFPFDVDFFRDRKIRSLKVRFGTDGIAIYIYILCMIYDEKGYYAKIDEDFYDCVADDLGINENTARQIMNYLCGRSMLLDGKLATSVKVLTSAKIQEVFQEAKKGSKRDIKVNPEYWLLKSEDTLGFIKFAQNEGFSEKNYSYSLKNDDYSKKNDTNKIKEKESKLNKSKLNKSIISGAVYDKDLKNIIKSYEGNIAPITTVVRESMVDWLKDVEPGVIIYAINEAAKHNVRTWAYINAVIKRQCDAGNKTLEAVQMSKNEYKLNIYEDNSGFDYSNIERIMQEKYDKKD